MVSRATRRKKRVLGPGAVERPQPGQSDLTLTPSGLRRAQAGASEPGLQTPQPEFDATLPIAHPGPQHIVSQVVVEPNRTVVHDVVVPITRQVSSWNCYARSTRGHKWHGVSPAKTDGDYVVTVGGTKLYLRGFGPSQQNSETGEVAWRWALENAASARGTELLVRFVVKLRRRPAAG